MKKLLLLMFIVTTLPVAGQPYSAIYITNATDLTFNVTINQVAGTPLPLYGQDRQSPKAGWTKFYTENTLGPNIKNLKLYSIDRTGMKSGTYDFGLGLYIPNGTSYIAFWQRLEAIAEEETTSTKFYNSAGVGGGSSLSSPLPNTTERGARYSTWTVPELNNRKICITYDRRAAGIFGLGYEDIYITLSDPPCKI